MKTFLKKSLGWGIIILSISIVTDMIFVNAPRLEWWTLFVWIVGYLLFCALLAIGAALGAGLLWCIYWFFCWCFNIKPEL